jgi:hypothetical protein
MILSIPFLASAPEQFDPRWPEQGFGVEASLFDRIDVVDPDRWETVCRTVREIARRHRPESFTFHSPVNDCDTTPAPLSAARRRAALDLVAECELDGMVLHSNRIRTVEQWRGLRLADEREIFAERVHRLGEQVAGAPFWIGLENMPITGNDAAELDPLLVFPADYAGLTGGNVGVTWDHCHFSYSCHVAGLLATGALAGAEDYPNVRRSDPLAFESLSDAVVHHHFSAFRGVADRAGGRCVEGVPPWAATVPEEVYATVFRALARSTRARAVTLEIREDDYTRRRDVFAVARWCRRLLEAGPHG